MAKAKRLSDDIVAKYANEKNELDKRDLDRICARDAIYYLCSSCGVEVCSSECLIRVERPVSGKLLCNVCMFAKQYRARKAENKMKIRDGTLHGIKLRSTEYIRYGNEKKKIKGRTWILPGVPPPPREERWFEFDKDGVRHEYVRINKSAPKEVGRYDPRTDVATTTNATATPADRGARKPDPLPHVSRVGKEARVEGDKAGAPRGGVTQEDGVPDGQGAVNREKVRRAVVVAVKRQVRGVRSDSPEGGAPRPVPPGDGVGGQRLGQEGEDRPDLEIPIPW